MPSVFTVTNKYSNPLEISYKIVIQPNLPSNRVTINLKKNLVNHQLNYLPQSTTILQTHSENVSTEEFVEYGPSISQSSVTRSP